ncbi:MAG: GNAT family N-acetyltransferase [Bacteroidales bacterium]|nr:MAG: GNAT family N-acetyltransferase [Bacteroidales bacterium]
MKTMDIIDPLLAILVKSENIIVGLAVAEFNRRKSLSEILSLYISKDHRHKGLGRKLIYYTTRALAQAGFKEARIYFRSNWESKGFIDKIAITENWTKPVTLMHIFKSNLNYKDKVIWTHDLNLPEGIRIESWRDINKSCKDELKKHTENDKSIPQYLSPFVNTDKIENLISVGLIKKTEIIGWNIVYRINKDTLEYNNLFIHKEYRKDIILPIALISRSVKLQIKNNITNFIWLVDNSDLRMLNFIYRKIGHLIDSDVLVMQTTKKLE